MIQINLTPDEIEAILDAVNTKEERTDVEVALCSKLIPHHKEYLHNIASSVYTLNK